MERQLTVREVVEETIKILEKINVPVSLIQDIGLPITRAIGNLNACCEAWTQEEIEKDHRQRQEEADEKQAANDGPHPVPAVEYETQAEDSQDEEPN